MHVPRGFVIGLAIAFVAGILAAATQASTASRYDDSPITVPFARAGDEFTYAQFEKGKPEPKVNVGSPVIYIGVPGPRTSANPRPTATHDPNNWTEPVYAGSKVGAVTRTPDASGELHETLLVTSHATSGSRATLLEYIDLQTRLSIRNDWSYKFADAGVRSEDIRSSFKIVKPQVPGIEYQGQTLSLGQDVSHLYILPSWIDPVLDEYSYESTVDQRVFIGDYDAYGIRTELHFREDGRSGTKEAHEAALFGDDFRLVLVEFTYVTANVPYPVVVHRYVNWIHGQQVQTYEELASLVQYRPGASPVAWANPADPPAYRTQNTDIERTMGAQTHPDGGRADRLLYPLGDAIQNVRDDPTLVRFQDWSLRNSGNRLVGANLAPVFVSGVREDPAHLKWSLIFATPEGAAFHVTTERSSSSPIPINQESSFQISVPPFDLTELPAHPVTIGAADYLWASMVSKHLAGHAPNRVQWGWYQPSRTSPISQLRELTIGLDLREDGEHDRSLLTVDTKTGNVLRFHEYRADFECGECVVGVYTSHPPALVPNTVPAGVSPPSMTQAAVAGTSFMALFAAIYFLPIVHFLGAQVFVFFPGFAKLRKEGILDNKLRDQILTLIKSEPGIHASDIARRVEAGWGTIVYHLSVLERSKMVSSLVDGRHKRFFPIGVVDFSRRGQLAVLRNTTTKTIFQMIAQDPGVIQGEIANRSSLSVPAAIWHLRRLEEAGLVGRAKDGRRVHYFANKEEDIPVPYDERDAVEIV